MIAGTGLILFFLHLFLLLGLSGFASAILFNGWAYRIAATAILAWANLVYTALFLSLFSQLSSTPLYFLLSISLTAGLCGVLWRLRIVPHAVDYVPPLDRSERATRINKWVCYFCVTTFCFAALSAAIICSTYYPNNWDSLAYRFPRPFFFQSQGNLLHSGSQDFRSTFYPFNISLVYLSLVKYQVDGRLWNFVSYFAWCVSGVGVWLMARDLGSSRSGALVAVWLALLSPIVFCLASSTNDEVIAGMPVLLAVCFLLNWFKYQKKRYLFLCFLAAGLALGSKLHWFFYWPSMGVGAVVLLGYQRKVLVPLLIRNSRLLAAGSLFALPLAASFLAANYLSAQRFTVGENVEKEIFNRPFYFQAAAQNIALFTVQLFLAPLPDLDIVTPLWKRRDRYADFNKVFNDTIFKNVKQGPPFTTPDYRFRGVADPRGYSYFEQTLWLGFVPHLLLAVLLFGLWRRALSKVAVMIGASFFAWHFGYSGQVRYVETACVYYAYPALLALGALGPGWDLALSGRDRWTKTLKIAFYVTFAVQMLFLMNLLAYNVQRNLPTLAIPGFRGETAVSAVAPRVRYFLQQAHNVYIPYTHWELLYFNFMRSNPGAEYRSGSSFVAPPGTDFMLLSLEGNVDRGMAPVRHPGTGSLTYLGEGRGPELYFGRGLEAQVEFPQMSGYFILPLRVENSASILKITAGGKPIGLDKAEEIQVKLAIGGSNRWTQTAWFTPSALQELTLEGQPADTSLVIWSRAAGDTKSPAVQTIHSMRAGARFLLDSPTELKQPPELSEGPTVAPEWGGLEVQLGPEVWGTEMTEWQGRPYSVRWLQSSTTFEIRNPGLARSAQIKLQLGKLNTPHTARLEGLSKGLSPTRLITRTFWTNGAQIETFRVQLQPGANAFRLSSVEAPEALPDGRRVCFLLIGDIVVTGDK